MRALTGAEAKVIGALLGSGLENQSEWLLRSGVPRSTFSVIRNRAFSEGWICERGVPSPDIGFRYILFALARPHVEGVEELARTWSEEKAAVLVWQAPEMVFGAFFLRTDGEVGELASRMRQGGMFHEISFWNVQASGSRLPVYFDYEGVWGHVCGSPTVFYPRSLPFPQTGGDYGAPSDGLVKKAGEMLNRPFRGGAVAGEVRRMGPSGFPRSWRKMLDQEWVSWRTFPDFARLPPYRERAISRVTIIHGDLVAGADPADLFKKLVEECRVFPFLYAMDGKHFLMGAMGTGDQSAGSGDRTRPVLPTLEGSLSGIAATSCEVQRVKVVLNHRYERLFGTV
jgi:hypothetical protein